MSTEDDVKAIGALTTSLYLVGHPLRIPNSFAAVETTQADCRMHKDPEGIFEQVMKESATPKRFPLCLAKRLARIAL
jgi:hypothetical protein